MTTKTSYVCTLDAGQIARLHEILSVKGWQFGTAPYAHWKATLGKTNVVAFQSGKVTVQGKDTAELVQFVLEPEILKEARFGYEEVWAEEEHPEMFTPHAGIDESGKGDYFGPLVVAAVHVTPETAHTLRTAGVADSKTIKSDRRIAALAGVVRTTARDAWEVVAIGPEAYNRLHAKFGNVNRLLAWGHAKTLENLLEKVPDCPRAISDQFGNKSLVLNALQARGRRITLEQHPRAEQDIAVAAASILARDEFVRRLGSLGDRLGVRLPKGAGAAVDKIAATLAARGGQALLGNVAKLHFRTTGKAMGTGD
jgi:ribonuclease HIII